MHDKLPMPNRGQLGHYYQNVVAISFMIDLLLDKCEKIIIECKIGSVDKFDDIKIFSGDEVHHYQVKSTYTDKNLTLSDFTNKQDLYLPDLFQTWKNIKFYEGKKNILHVFTSRTLQSTESLRKYLFPKNIFSDFMNNTYEIKPEIFEVNKLKTILPSSSSQEQKSFLKSLVLEVNQPKISTDMLQPEFLDSEWGQHIREKLKPLGLHQKPHNMDYKEVYTILLRLAYERAIPSTPITKNDLENALNIKQKYKIVQNNIVINYAHYVRDDSKFKAMTEQLSSQSGKRIIVVGKPGSGKTWFLTKWLKEFEEENIDLPPIYYYLSTSVIEDRDDAEIRITGQQLLNNLINDIKDKYDDIQIIGYESTLENLQKFIYELGKIATDKKTTIPIIIDGLDHIHRVKRNADTTISDELLIVEILNKIRIPPGLCLIIGSQPLDYLDPEYKKMEHSVTVHIEGFAQSQVQKYMENLELPKFVIKKYLNVIYERTCGLPLLINYIVKYLKETQNYEEVDEIPLTKGDIKKYYEYLWLKFSDPTQTRKIARFFALLDFTVDNMFLNKLLPSRDLDGEIASENLKELSFLLHRNAEEEISIFHDSFREYILADENFKSELKIQYLNQIYNCLNNKENIIDDQKSFRHCLKYGLKCEKYNDVMNRVDIKFIDDSMKNLNTRKDLENNIIYSINAAGELKLPIRIIEQGLLKKYTIERYEHLSGEVYQNLIVKLFPKKIPNYLIFENKLKLTMSETLDYLALYIQNRSYIDDKKIKSIWSVVQQTYCEKSLISLKDAENIALIKSYVDGVQNVIDWICKFDFPIDAISKMLTQICKIKTFDEVANFNNLKSKYGSDWIIIELQIFYCYKKHAEFLKKFQDIDNCQTFPNFLDYLKYSEIEPNLVSTLIHKVVLQSSGRDQLDINTIYEFQKQIGLCSYLTNTKELKILKNEIDKQSSSRYKVFLELLFIVTHTYHNHKTTSKSLEDIYEKLKKIADYDIRDLSDGPYDFNTDLPSLVSLIIKYAFKMILSSNDTRLKNKLIDIIPILGKRLIYTKLYMQDIVEFVYLYTLDSRLRRKAASKIPPLYSETADYSVTTSLLNSNIEILNKNKDKAIGEFNKAVEHSFAYGYHKDIFLDELRHVSELIGKEMCVERSRSILKYMQYLDIITDRDWLNNIYSDTLKFLCLYFPYTSFQFVLKNFGVDSHIFGEILSTFTTKNMNCNILIRYFLLRTRLVFIYPHSTSSHEAFNERIMIINDGVKNKSIIDVKIMLNDLKIELTRDFPKVTTKMINSFNKLALQYKIGIIDSLTLTNIEKEDTRSNQNFENENFQNLSLDELFEKFSKYGLHIMGGKQYRDILKLTYRKNKIETEKTILKHLKTECVNNKYGPTGLLDNYAQYLKDTEQKSQLKELYKIMNKTIQLLLRHEKLRPEENFKYLLSSKTESDPTEIGFDILFSRFKSDDTEVIRRSIESVTQCLLNDVENLLSYCISKFSNSDDSYLKEIIAIILDKYVTMSQKPNSDLFDIAIKMIEDVNRNIVNSGTNILQILRKNSDPNV